MSFVLYSTAGDLNPPVAPSCFWIPVWPEFIHTTVERGKVVNVDSLQRLWSPLLRCFERSCKNKRPGKRCPNITLEQALYLTNGCGTNFICKAHPPFVMLLHAS